MLSAVQNTPKKAVVHSASRSVSRIRSPFHAPTFVEMIGCDA